MTRKRRMTEQNESPVFDGESTEETVDVHFGDVEVEDYEDVEVAPPLEGDEGFVLSAEELMLAKKLTGSPILVSEDELEIYQRLAKFNVAADFGDEGFARGFKWKQHCV